MLARQNQKLKRKQIKFTIALKYKILKSKSEKYGTRPVHSILQN